MADTIKCKITESLIKVKVDKLGSQVDRIWELLDAYLIIQDVSSQANGVNTDFVVTYIIYNDFKNIFINGIKEHGHVKIDDHTIRILPAPDAVDLVEIEYIKGE